MIISNKNGNTIYKSWRENGKRKSEELEFRPYFYVLEDEVERNYYPLNKYTNGRFEYEDGDWKSLEGEPLKRVYVEKSYDINSARQLFTKTYEADVPYTFRYAVDEVNEMPEYNMRKWYWDMEWQQGGEYDGCITTIVVYDNYNKKYTQFTWFPEGHPFYVSSQRIDYNEETKHNTYVCRDEKFMLEVFMGFMIAKDPDMLIAWFGLKFDLPKLLDRACALGLNPLIMSPYHKIDGVKQLKKGCSFKRQDGYSPIEQPIGGRLTLNLDLAFERQWNDSQRGTLPSLSLDYVSKILFDEGKVMETKFEDPNEFYRRAWLEDTEAYLHYALVDVELLVRIDESNYCSEAIISLQRLLKAPFKACFYASHMGSIYFMRNAWWKAPTGIKSADRREYQGAMIYDPLSENTNGLHLNVAAFDFAGLYPSMMVARNISWETKSQTPTEFGVNILTPRDFSEVEGEQMHYYRTDELGLLPKAVLELKELRNDYKKRMKNSEGDEYVKWYNNQMAVKRLMASFYGVLAFQGFGWADVDLAASITASAREAIRLAAFKAKELEV
jgi:DNA polymerase I|tara:strand:- start:6587 stop:8251 length:1665 start_codon:yes stop_codon:yes gene_type:complete